MFIFLSKFLPLLIYPIGLTFILLVISILVANRKRVQKAIIIFIIILLGVSGNRFVALSLVRSLEWQYLPPQEIPQGEVIVVLGGATDAAVNPRTGVEVNGAADRILYASRLYHEGKAEHLLLSGGNISWLGTQSSTPAGEMAEILELLNVPRDAMWLEDESRNTYENALYCSKILKEKGISRVLLVTSAVHMPRSVMLFEKQGVEVIPLPTDFSVTQAGWDDLFSPDIQTQLINLVPTVGNISATSNVMKEYIGMVVYRMNGWL